MTATSAPAPTPALPPKATAPATPSSCVLSVARTVASWVAAPLLVGLMRPVLPTTASVCSFIKVTVAEPATPTLPPPAPPAAIDWMSSNDVAVIATPVLLSVCSTPAPSLRPVATLIAARLPRAVALPSRRALTVLSVINREADAPMPTLPPTDTLPARLNTSTSSRAATCTLPSAVAVEPASMAAVTAWVVCTTVPAPARPTLLATPPAAEMASTWVVDVAPTAMLPAAESTLVLPFRRASTTLSTSFQAKDTPTPALSLEAPSAPASPKMRELSLAARTTPASPSTPSPPFWPETTVRVLLRMVLTVTAPEAAIGPLLAPMAAEMVSMLLSVCALIVTRPVASMSLSLTPLSVVLLKRFQPNDKPTPALPPKAMAPAMARMAESSRAFRSTLLTPVSRVLWMAVWVVLPMLLIDTDPATPTLPLAPAMEADRVSMVPVTCASAVSAPLRLTVALLKRLAVVPDSVFWA